MTTKVTVFKNYISPCRQAVVPKIFVSYVGHTFKSAKLTGYNNITF